MTPDRLDECDDMKRMYMKHRFDPSVIMRIRTLYRLDNWHAIAALALDYTIIATAMLAVHVIGWPAYPFAVVVIGARQRALSTIVHEAAHGTLARSKALTRLLSTVGSGYLVFTTPDAYKASHVTYHHGRFGDPMLDTDFRYMLDMGVYRIGSRKAYVWRTIVKPLLLGNVPSYIAYLAKARTLSLASGNGRLEAAMLCAFWAIVIAVAVAMGQLTNLLLFWIVPFLTTFQVIGWFIELAEHAPLMHNRSDLHMTRNRHSHWLEQFLTGMHGENYHLAHHLQPRVPFWRMGELHRILLHDPHYRQWDSQCGGIFLSENSAPSVMTLLSLRCNQA